MTLVVPELPRQACEELVGTRLVRVQSIQTHELERPRYRSLDFGLCLCARGREQNPREGQLPLRLEVALAAPGGDAGERFADQAPCALGFAQAEIRLAQRDEG